MKRLVSTLIFMVFIINPVLAKNAEKLDVKSNSFMDLGRYVETLELNGTDENESETADDFEETAIQEVFQRYEGNAVELKLDNNSDDAINSLNSARVFKLKVNETQYNIENNIKAENMIWDSSKSFSQAFINNTRHLAPIPSIVNSSKIRAGVSKSVTASLGQTSLNDAVGTSVLFVRANESTYNTGSVLTYKGESLNIAVGSFSSSYNHASSGGIVLSTSEINLPKNLGSFAFGGAYMANEQDNYDKNTGGVFAEYRFKRLKLNVQAGESKYTNSNDYDTGLYFVPELKITDSLTLKTRFIRNVTQDTMQDEFVLNYKPKKNNNNLEIELSTTNRYTDTSTINQRIKLSTSFKI